MKVCIPLRVCTAKCSTVAESLTFNAIAGSASTQGPSLENLGRCQGADLSLPVCNATNVHVCDFVVLIAAATSFGLTGTVIQNHLEELWNIVDWAQPDLLGTLEQMRQEYVGTRERERERESVCVCVCQRAWQ
jgi:hypothetical protein